jgi:hypothetical protein
MLEAGNKEGVMGGLGDGEKRDLMPDSGCQVPDAGRSEAGIPDAGYGYQLSDSSFRCPAVGEQIRIIL